MAGLFILKHMHNLSDEVLWARWLENPYYQFFCGELSFCYGLPFDRSSVAHKTGALATRDLERGGRHHGAAQSGRPSDRRAAVSSRAGKIG
jgi:hypothetical protein